MTSTPLRRGTGALLAVVVTATLSAGCSSSHRPTPPAAVRAALAQVDAALGAQDYRTARQALDALVRGTVAARDQGRLSAAEADRVLAAATRLLVDLPVPVATPTPTPVPPAVAPPPPRHDGGHGKGHKHED